MKNIVDVLSLQNRVQENKLQKVKPTDYRYNFITLHMEHKVFNMRLLFFLLIKWNVILVNSIYFFN